MDKVYSGILLSHKKEWNNFICSDMNGPRDHHMKWNKSDKDNHHMILLTCGILKMMQRKKNDAKENKNRNRCPDIENKLMLTKGNSGEWKGGID